MGSILPTHPPTYVTLGPTEGFFMLHGSHSLLNKFWKNFFIISQVGGPIFINVGVFEKILEKKIYFFSHHPR
jgi:hypothetical protein